MTPSSTFTTVAIFGGKFIVEDVGKLVEWRKNAIPARPLRITRSVGFSTRYLAVPD